MANLLIDMVRIVSGALSLLIIVRALMSWVRPNLSNPLVSLVHRLTEPVLGPVRGLLPATGGFDFSPIIVLIGVQVLERVLIQLLIGMA